MLQTFRAQQSRNAPNDNGIGSRRTCVSRDLSCRIRARDQKSEALVCDSLPDWMSVRGDSEPTMVFDQNCHIGVDFDNQLLDLMQDVLPPFNIMELLKQDAQH